VPISALVPGAQPNSSPDELPISNASFSVREIDKALAALLGVLE
jgi:hypothetical protein